MSIEAVKWAMYDAPMPALTSGRPDTVARAVLFVLAEHADASGLNAHPSPDRVAVATGHDERTVRRALQRLVDAKLTTRDGTSRYGTARWKLAMELARPESDWEAVDARRRAESRARQARRARTQPAADDPLSGTDSPGHEASPSMHREPETEAESGTHSPGQIDAAESVRYPQSRCPVPTIPDVRDCGPPEPPREPPGTTSTGEHAAPQTPLRPPAPTTSGQGNEQPQDHPPGPPTTNSQDRNHRPRTRGTAQRRTANELTARLARYLGPDPEAA